MNDILVSVMIPSRDRIDILKNSIKSLLDNVAKPHQIQILIKFDFDDYSSFQRFHEIYNVLNLKHDKIIFGPRFRGYKDHHLFLNDLAKLAEGEFLFTWNDDTTMMSKDWDKEVEKYKGQFIVLKPKHNMYTLPDFNGNPIFPRKWAELTGHVALNCHTDNWIHDIATSLGIQKEVDITIRNDAAHWGGFVDDRTYHEGSIFAYDHDDYYGSIKTQLRDIDKNKITQYINTIKS